MRGSSLFGVAAAALSFSLSPLSVATAAESHAAVKTFGDVQVHITSGAEVSSENAWKLFARSLGLHENTEPFSFAGDIYARPLAGALVLLEGLTLSELQTKYVEEMPNLNAFFKANPTLAVQGEIDAQSLVLPMVKELRVQKPNSLLLSAAGLQHKDGEADSALFDRLAELTKFSAVRAHRATCDASSACTVKLTGDFTPKEFSGFKTEFNFVVASSNSELGVAAQAADILASELALARKVIQDLAKRHESKFTDAQQDVVLLRFRLANQNSASLKSLDQDLPALLAAIAKVVPSQKLVAEVVLYPATLETVAQAQRRLSTSASGNSSTVGVYEGTDYILVSWTVVWLGVLALVLFVCVPWVDPLDPMLRSQLKNEIEDKRE